MDEGRTNAYSIMLVPKNIVTLPTQHDASLRQTIRPLGLAILLVRLVRVPLVDSQKMLEGEGFGGGVGGGGKRDQADEPI